MKMKMHIYLENAGEGYEFGEKLYFGSKMLMGGEGGEFKEITIWSTISSHSSIWALHVRFNEEFSLGQRVKFFTKI